MVRSARAEKTRETLLQTGVELVSKNGFNHTGIGEILKACGVPKGSFYHYFESKEDFGLQLIEFVAEPYRLTLIEELANTQHSPLTRLKNYYAKKFEAFKENGCQGGCIFGNMAQELSDQNPRLRERLNEVFETWLDLIAGCFTEAQKTGEVDPSLDPKELAEFFIISLEGAALRAKVTKSPQSIEIFWHYFFNRLIHGLKDS